MAGKRKRDRLLWKDEVAEILGVKPTSVTQALARRRRHAEAGESTDRDIPEPAEPRARRDYKTPSGEKRSVRGPRWSEKEIRRWGYATGRLESPEMPLEVPDARAS